jgi:signal transduction histidine kinase
MPAGVGVQTDANAPGKPYAGLMLSGGSISRPRPPLTEWPRPRRWVVLDWAVALGYGLCLAVVPKYVHVPLYPVGIAVVGLALAVRRRYPLTALAVVLAVLFPAWASVWSGVMAWTYVLYIVAATHRLWTVLAALAATLANLVLALAFSEHPQRELVWSVAVPALTVTVVATIGYAIGRHRAYERELRLHQAGQEQVALERARRDVTEERMRIARDLHDVVAHSMSVITVQAAFGHLVIDTQPEQARTSLDIIETTGRQTLTEMRQLLGVLRADGPDRSDVLAPAPRLADLGDLITQTALAGVQVDLRITGEPRDLPPGVDASAYRIVQEALTNVVKHAHTTTGRVTVDYRPDELSIEVTDEGAGHSGSTGGHGLLGMRERVNLYGGQLSAASLPARGFRVHARLPFAELGRPA